MSKRCTPRACVADNDLAFGRIVEAVSQSKFWAETCIFAIEDDPQNGIAFSGSTVRVWKRLRDDEQVYGLGSKTGDFNKRGRQLGGYNYTMWNSDTFGYMGDTDPIYASIPFFLVLRNGRTHGIFMDNASRSTFDIGRESQSMISFGAEEGELGAVVEL